MEGENINIAIWHTPWTLQGVVTGLSGPHLWGEEEASKTKTHPSLKVFFGRQAQKINEATRLNHPLKRWERVHMLFIPKDEEETPQITRLRPIDSFDSEIDLLRRVLVSHRTMAQAKETKSLTDFQ